MNSKDRRGLGLIGTTIVVGVLVVLFGGGPYVLNVLQTSFLVGNSTSTNPLNQAKQVIDQLTQKGSEEQKRVEQLGSSSTINTSTRIYRNEDCGFEVKVPDSFGISFFSDSNCFKTYSVTFANQSESSEIGIQVYNGNPQFLSLQDWLRSEKWPSPEPIEEQFEVIGRVGGVDAVQQTQTEDIYFVKNDRVFIIQNGIIDPWEGFKRRVTDDTFKVFLSTFKFIK